VENSPAKKQNNNIKKQVEEKRREWLVINYLLAEMTWVDTR
jgi:hypothetical protein